MHDPSVLIEGVLFRARYLGSTQLVCEGQPTKATRMMQAEEAVSRIKVISYTSYPLKIKKNLKNGKNSLSKEFHFWAFYSSVIYVLINGVFTGVFTCQRVACEDAGRAAYSQLRSRVTGEYNRQQASISSQTTEYVARHLVYTQWVHLYSRMRSQKLEISSV